MKINQVLEDYANCRVPEDKRKSLWHLCTILFAAIITIPVFIIAQSIISGSNFVPAVLATVIGLSIIGSLAIMLAYIGGKTNLTSAMIIRITFGKQGGKIVSLILGLSLLGWFGITVDFFGSSLSEILSLVWNVNISTAIITVLAGVLMMSSTIIGFKGLDKISMFFSPVLIFILITMLYKIFSIDNSLSILMSDSLKTLSMSQIISIWIGGVAAGTVLPPDITRFSKSPKDGAISYVFAFLFMIPLISIIAMAMLKIADQNSFSSLVSFLSMGILGIVFLFAATWTTNDNNLYSSALSISVLFKKIPKWKVAIILGLLGIVLGVSQVFKYFVPLMTILGVFIVPVSGIIIADYFLLNKKEYKLESSKYNGNIKALVSWFIASGLGLCTTTKVSGGLELFKLTSIPAVDSIIIGFVLYLGLKKIKGKRYEKI